MTLGATTDDDRGPISVLIVDDDANWAQLAARLLNKTEWAFEVATTTDAVEALEAVRTDPPDCVVSDFRMPGLTGIEFLREVRQDHPDLPFIIVTSKGDESIASRAIAEGVTDYLPKGHDEDHGTLLATRIRNAVQQRRTRAELEASEARYRAVVENVQHAILILVDGRIQFVNSTATDLTGLSEAALVGAGLDAFVDPAELSAVERLLDGRGDENATRDLTVQTDDGDIRECEVERVDIRYGDTEAVMLVVTDVSERRRRRRALRRERDAKEAVREILLNHSTPDGLVEAFCRHVVSGAEYDFAWIGTEVGGTDPTVVAAAGAPESYLDAIGFTEANGDDGLLDDEPGVKAIVDGLNRPIVTHVADRPDGTDRNGAGSEIGTGTGYRTGDGRENSTGRGSQDRTGNAAGNGSGVQSGAGNGSGVQSGAGNGDPASRWRRHAGDHGFAVVATVPLRYNGIDYGVLAVYASSPDAFDSHRLRTLSEVGEAAAYALSVAEYRETLMTDEPILVTLRIGDDLPGLSALQAALGPGGRIEVDRAVSLSEERDRYFGTAIDADLDGMTTAADGLVEIAVDDDAGYPNVRFALDRPSLVCTVVEVGGEFRDATIAPEWIEVRVAFPPDRPTGELLDRLRVRFDDVSLVSQWREGSDARRRTTGNDPLERLTDKQLTAVETAHEMGFFEQPREHYAEDVAEALGVSRSTFGHHLRSAHETVYESLLEGFEGP